MRDDDDDFIVPSDGEVEEDEDEEEDEEEAEKNWGSDASVSRDDVEESESSLLAEAHQIAGASGEEGTSTQAEEAEDDEPSVSVNL